MVGGGGVVVGGLGLQMTPAASVLSQSCLPQPSNLQKNSWAKTFAFMLAMAIRVVEFSND